MKKKLFSSAFMILTAILLMLPMSLQSAGKEGMLLSLSCTSCHGTYGLSPGAIPTLYGKSRKYLVKVLTEFRNGNRDSTVMERIAKGYSDKDIRLIANYFASLAKDIEKK